jgi:hypothetical protein
VAEKLASVALVIRIRNAWHPADQFSIPAGGDVRFDIAIVPTPEKYDAVTELWNRNLYVPILVNKKGPLARP